MNLSNFIRGQVLIIAIVFFAVILVLVAALFSQVGIFLGFGSRGRMAEQATALADAGVERALYMLNQTAGNYYGDLTELPLGTTGTFFITVVDKGQYLKGIVATGYVPNSTNPKSQRTIKVDAIIDSANITFRYAVQVGTGGVEMENSSTINGNVYSNAGITGSGTSTINGDAYAVGTISSPDPFVTGTKRACPTDCQPASQMPTIDYDFWKDKADDGGETNCAGGTCTYSSDTTNIGPRKIVGNLVVSNTAIINIQGPIWVTGNVTVQNSAQIKLDSSFGSKGTVLITDGKVSTANSGTFVPTSANPKGYILVVTTSTLNDAVKIQNSGVNAVFYALDGGADLENTAQVTALVAKRLELENSATLNYDTGLANSSFTTGPGGSWGVKKGTYKFVANP
ncbi:hypothetical protein A3A60_00595 [Candidatus Curtissbacteria bacterium RIFCSPLOWO2_01_FULL_42_26]|uniref:Type 4 fimbrial biogenesis protein PilX N-terminal domain-containing protein n=1 Tax=Candidatus Curtissbacteria bacterium RIFCSPLOWO2_01_FULL_42_26 TaxID=1797729 RepID=A0A1F5I1M8_9BACT|nr:MAG: hypothetical protein A3A60_00595 [Candidatus Curtissbacteria bacterium RIFCSPLOWO2_01_FULL_42_26]